LGRERLAWATGVLLLGLVSAFALAGVARQAPREPEIRFDIAMPPDLDILSLAISPDGQRIAFVARADGRPNVWIHTLDGRAARPLEGTDDAQDRVFWSPDSGSLGVFAEGKLKRIDLQSGAVQTLADAPLGAGGAWSRDGVILFAPTRGPLFRVSQGGGATTAVTRVEGPSIRHVSPQFLPDGRHFLFFSAGDPDLRGVYVADLEGAAEPRRLLADADAAAVYETSGHLLFPRQGALLAQRFDVNRLALSGEPWQVTGSVGVDQTQGATRLSVSDTGSLVYRGTDVEARQRRLVWHDRSGKELQRLDDRDPVNANHMALSPDGRRLAVSRDSIWMFDTARGLLTRFTSQQDSIPLWSPDGTRLVFQSTRDGVRNLYHRELTGSEDELLLATPGSKGATDWSPDGRLLLYRDVDPRTGFDLWVLPFEHEGAGAGPAASLDGESGNARGRLRPVEGASAVPIAHTSATETNGQFSPDGQWIAYESDESGRFEIYVQGFGRQGTRQRVSLDGGTQARWRSDGTELYFIAPGGLLNAIPLRLSGDGGPSDFGAPVPLFHVRVDAGDPAYPQYIVSRDGQRFLVNTIVDAGPGVISAIFHWTPPR
jgi:Tol biopolymer transport system component